MALPISDYAACHHDREAPIDEDNNGVFFLNGNVTYDDLEDGAKHTLFIGEKLGDLTYDLGWLSGTPATLRNAGPPLATGFDWRVIENVPPWFVASGRDWGFTYGDSEFTEEELTLAEEPPTRFGPAFDQDGDDTEAAPDQADAAAAKDGLPPAPEPAASGEAADEESSVPSGDGSTTSPQASKQKAAESAGGNSLLGGDPSRPLAVGGFGGFHPGGVMFAFGDGSVEFLAEHVSQVVLRRLAHRRDGQMVSAADR
jgi:prepilin-type processing-associated H-X9-DG protein